MLLSGPTIIYDDTTAGSTITTAWIEAWDSKSIEVTMRLGDTSGNSVTLGAQSSNNNGSGVDSESFHKICDVNQAGKYQTTLSEGLKKYLRFQIFNNGAVPVTLKILKRT